MGRASTYTDAQREAVRRALTDDGMTAKETAEAAAAGELYDLEPFALSLSSAYEIANDAALRNPAAASEDDPNLALQLAAVDDTIARLQREGEHLRAQPMGRLDSRKLAHVIKATREAILLRKALLDRRKPRTNGRRSSPDVEPTGPTTADRIRQLAAKDTHDEPTPGPVTNGSATQ